MLRGIFHNILAYAKLLMILSYLFVVGLHSTTQFTESMDRFQCENHMYGLTAVTQTTNS